MCLFVLNLNQVPGTSVSHAFVQPFVQGTSSSTVEITGYDKPINYLPNYVGTPTGSGSGSAELRSSSGSSARLPDVKIAMAMEVVSFPIKFTMIFHSYLYYERLILQNGEVRNREVLFWKRVLRSTTKDDNFKC